MLRPEAQVVQRWQFKGWNGTPRQLADAVTAIRHLLPDAKFRATVAKLNGPTQVADEPAGLGAIPLELRFDTIDIDLDEHRQRPGSQWDSDYYWIKLRFGRIDDWNEVRCRGENELQSRTMLQAAREALAPGVPWHVRLRGAVWWKPAAAFVCGLLVAVGVRLSLSAVASARVASVVGSVLLLPAYLLAFAAIQWLLPNFELYSEKPRRRRFGWALLTLVVLQFLIGVLVAALTGD